MRIIVVGAGEVGSTTAADLAADHEVTVVDLDADRVEALQYQEDVLGLAGDGTDLDVLREAGIAEADMLIASTDSDEANIVACGTAKTAADVFTIARVRKPSLLRTWEGSEGAFGVDFMVSVDLLTAQTIVRITGLPGAEDVDTFTGGLVRMVEFRIRETSPVAGLTVEAADRYDALTFAAVIRDGETIVPRGDTEIRAGDRLVVIGRADSCRAFATELEPESPDDDLDVVVVGGGPVGRGVARLLADGGHAPRLIERDETRARELAEQYPNVTVMAHDATDLAFLDRENVGEADVVVSTLSDDERNLLVCLLAKRVGAARTVAVVETGDYVEPFEAVGVDVAVNPRRVTAEEIIRFTLDKYAENLAIVGEDDAEVLEVELDADSELVGRPIRESITDLPAGVVIGAVTRASDGRVPRVRGRVDTTELEFVTPRGDTVLRAGDHVVLFVDTDAIEEVTARL
jgi:trk system potassium uptake protein TrkA